MHVVVKQLVTAQENTSALTTRKLRARSLYTSTPFTGYSRQVVAQKTVSRRCLTIPSYSVTSISNFQKEPWKPLAIYYQNNKNWIGSVLSWDLWIYRLCVRLQREYLKELKTVIQCLGIKPKAINTWLLYQGHWSQWHIKLNQERND